MIALLVIAIIGILCFIVLLVGLFIIYRYFKKVAEYTARIK